VYATCLFCDAPFGANDALETLPVGRRIAFDADVGRLWVVCRRCERWNLTPLDERWEAIEDAERLFRATRLRVSTDNIGMARLRDGTDLVRVGRPLRPEFAAWRYGDQLGRRRRRALALGGAGAVAAMAAAPAALGAFWSGGIFVAGWVSAGAQVPYLAARDYVLAERVVARVAVPVAAPGARTGAALERTVDVRVRHLRESALLPYARADEAHAPRLLLAHDGGETELHGARAARALGVLLAQANQWGASGAQVRAAVQAIDERGDAAGWLHTAARRSSRAGGRVMAAWRRVGALSLTPVERLAVEMALHEAQERAVLEGELAHLAEAWREAEEIGAIADAL
jgi:hypothetical protein